MFMLLVVTHISMAETNTGFAYFYRYRLGILYTVLKVKRHVKRIFFQMSRTFNKVSK